MSEHSNTLVIQSQRSPLPYPWLEPCLGSVRNWCSSQAYDYQFLGDALFNCLPARLLEKCRTRRVIATDLARLIQVRQALSQDYGTVVWLDADFLVFNPVEFLLPKTRCAIGREVWVQEDRDGKLRAYVKVHNAFLMFRRGDSFLDFYIDTASRLLERNQGSMPPQFIGPKLLTALHNVAVLPVLETAGMLSPLVIREILNQDGPALSLFRARSTAPLAGANLCSSSCDSGEVSVYEMETLVKILLKQRAIN